MELPSNYLEEMKELLGDQYEAYLASFEQKTRQGLRVNTAKIAPETFRQKADISLECVPWCENGFAFDEKQTVTKHPYYYAGLYYVQEPSAMIPASHLPVEPGDFVLDLCAAPGGKATELGAKLKGKGMLLANDISNSRAKGLLKNLELFGISNLFVSSEESDKLKKAYPAYFDKILIDAPCSGEGMFRRDKAMVKDWLQKGPDYYVPIQRKLLLDAADMLKKGGMLLYSTCTFSVKENEENIAYLLQERPDMELLMPEWDEYFSHGKKEGFENCIRIFPHLAPGEGHFAALLGKRTDGEGQSKKYLKKPAKSKKTPVSDLKDCPEFAVFMQQITKPLSGKTEVQKERIYLLPEGTKIERGIRYLRTGLYLGDQKKKRFEPSQALSMCLKAEDFKKSVSFKGDDERVIRYLKGETLDLSDTEAENEKGWVLVCVDGYGLGWGKAAGGTLKNKYYAGWRMQS